MERLKFEDLQFSVDEERRTITGIVVPWDGVSTPKGGRRYQFARGSLKCVDPKFVKFLEDHNPDARSGRAIRMEETDKGLVATFKVSEGPRGDRVLSLAQRGLKTGLSVGVEFDASDTEAVPESPGTYRVHLANLEEVSHVREPSFTDSRLISVRASATEGEQVDPEEQTPAAQPGTQQVSFTADQLAWMQANGLGIHHPPAQPAKLEMSADDKKAEFIPPKRTAVVTEPQNYRFDRDGELQPAKHDFGVDVVRGWNPAFNDQGARDRVNEWIAAQFDVATTDVNELLPGQNRDRYIDQREYRYPIFNAVNRGAPINGVEPFTWDKFNSASGLVGAHTEGVEPSSGTYTTASQTVVPGAISGKAKITREAWDAGGRRGLSGKIWGQMVRGYYEGAEAKVVAALNAETPTGITFTTGGGTTGQTLALEMRRELAKLHFVRGGFRFDTAFSQIDLYLALSGALDDSGRPLFPAIGPTNADGTVANRYQSINVNGVPFLPAWALAATGTVAASSYLIDSEAVDAWITTPRQLNMPEIEVAHVYIGIWGYSAAAVNDLAGVRELIYDPAA